MICIGSKRKKKKKEVKNQVKFIPRLRLASGANHSSLTLEFETFELNS